MNAKQRQKIERRIVKRVSQDALAAGYSVTVDDGGEEFGPFTHTADVLDRMFSVDQETIYLRKLGSDEGLVFFVYGNDGHDVIADYSLNMEELLSGANKLADEICNAS